MSKIKVNEVTNLAMDGPVYFPNGIIGDGSQMILKPGVETFSPTNLSTNNALDGVIQIGYNQPIQFSGIGTITIRAGAVDGTIHEEFTCGVSTRASIAGNVLTIDPATDYDFGETYFVSIPSPGIANTSGGFASSITGYQFTCRPTDYTGDGGDYVFTAYDSNSPTNYYKYHIFANPGIYTSSSPSQDAEGFALMLIGGGGAGGGGYWYSYSEPSQPHAHYAGGGAGGLVKYESGAEANLPSGSLTITVGVGGSSLDSSGNFANGVQPREQPTPTNAYGGSGGDTTIVLSPTSSLVANGGGSGGSSFSPRPIPEMPTSNPTYQSYRMTGQPGGSGGGSTAQSANTPYSGGTGVITQGNPGGNSFYYQHPTTSPNSGWGGGGGGGAGSAGGSGVRYYIYSPTQHSIGRHGAGGNGIQVPVFPGPTIMPRIPIGPQIHPRMQGSYYAGGGSGGGEAVNPYSPTFGGYQQRGGYGGGGAPGFSPWRPGSPLPMTYPSIPGIPPTGEPANGAQLLGGGGAGGYWRGSYWPQRSSYPIDTHPNQREYADRFAGNGGSGSVMIRYAHPGS